MCVEDTTALVARAVKREPLGWIGLVDRFGGKVLAVTRSHRLSEADAADVYQTTWLRLSEHIDRIRDPERVGAWLVTTARNECLRLVKASGRVVVTPDLDDRPADEMAVDAQLLRAERRVAFQEALARLPEPCQRLLRLRMGDPTPSNSEIAAELGVAYATVAPMVGRCCERLRRQIPTSLRPASTASEAR